MEETHERKLAKCTELVEQCRSRRWRAQCQPVEVSCRGFTVRSLSKAPVGLGLSGAENKSKTCSTTEAAGKAAGLPTLVKKGKPVDWYCWDASRTWSTLDGSPGRWGLMLKDPKPLMIPGTSLMMHPSATLSCILKPSPLIYYYFHFMFVKFTVNTAYLCLNNCIGL